MENPTTPIQKLDVLLKLLQQQNGYRTRNQIDEILKQSSIVINQDDLIRALDKLVNDGYIIETKQDNRSNLVETKYLISHKGYLFDSYAAKSLRDASDAEQQSLEIERLRNLDRNSEKNQIRLNRLTRWLAVGTIALAVMEIIKFLCEIDPCVKEFFQKML